MSEVGSLIVMIMSGSAVGAGWGCLVGKECFLEGGMGERVRYGESCPVIFPVIPCLLL